MKPKKNCNTHRIGTPSVFQTGLLNFKTRIMGKFGRPLIGNPTHRLIII